SDRGSQYASDHYQRLLGKHGITCSMSRVAQCWDNAPVESFFASLKRELVHDASYTTRAQAQASIFAYVEPFYHRVGLHSALGYLSPEQFERSHNPKPPYPRLHFSWGRPLVVPPLPRPRPPSPLALSGGPHDPTSNEDLPHAPATRRAAAGAK